MTSLLLLATPFLIEARMLLAFLATRRTAGSCSAAVGQYSWVSFCLATVQPLSSQPVMLQTVVVTKVQDLALGLVKFHFVEFSPSIQPVQLPLTIQQMTLAPNFVSTANLIMEDIQIDSKGIKQD
ncbi:hypothetical protein TURU_093176 [Turdus rufiventris]|nr:hypothetical protein TURU_093176 [Turdus rufiventris]